MDGIDGRRDKGDNRIGGPPKARTPQDEATTEPRELHVQWFLQSSCEGSKENLVLLKFPGDGDKDGDGTSMGGDREETGPLPSPGGDIPPS